jgi:hypothetical protein
MYSKFSSFQGISIYHHVQFSRYIASGRWRALMGWLQMMACSVLPGFIFVWLYIPRCTSYSLAAQAATPAPLCPPARSVWAASPTPRGGPRRVRRPLPPPAAGRGATTRCRPRCRPSGRSCKSACAASPLRARKPVPLYRCFPRIFIRLCPLYRCFPHVPGLYQGFPKDRCRSTYTKATAGYEV